MSDAAEPVGFRREQALIECLADMSALIEEFADELPLVNDPSLQPNAALLIETAEVVFSAHRGNPKPSIADDLAGLMSAVRGLRIPGRDPDLGRTPTFDRLRAKQGLIVMGLADALEAAAALGLQPQVPPIPQDMAAELPRADVAGLLNGILRRLAEVERSLDALEDAKSEPTNFAQQTGLLNFYAGSMRVEIDMAKLHLSVGEPTVDFNALARAVDNMASLTQDFVSTIKSWADRVTESIVAVAEEMPGQIRKLARGIATTVKRVMRLAARRPDNVVPTGQDAPMPLDAEAIARPVDPLEELAAMIRPNEPTDFNHAKVHAMILAGQEPPVSWRPRITELSFIRTNIADLEPLRGLAQLRTLDLTGTPVADLAPLSGLVQLQTLYLSGTRVVDLAPLRSLTRLEMLYLSRTRVDNITPLSGLVRLDTLDLSRTRVDDIAPLSGLTRLGTLDLSKTRVADLAPLRGLRRLGYLNVTDSKVTKTRVLADIEWLKIVGAPDRKWRGRPI